MTTGSTGIAYAPTISGTAADQSTTNEAPVTPFSGVTIGDENPDATDTLTITVSGGVAGVGFVPAYGWLIGAGPSSASGGVGGVYTYTLSGTAAAITGELDALVFTLGGGTPNTRSTFEFTLSDVSNADSTPAVASTMVTDTDPAVAPVILGAVAGQTATFGAAVKPFSGVEVLDENAAPFDMLTISLSNGGSGGTLTGAGLSGGSGGVYTLSGSPNLAFQSELDALVFTPTNGTPNTSATTDFTLSDVAVNSTRAVDSTTTVTVTDPAVAPTISGTVAGQTTANEAPVTPFSGVTIGDANNGAIDTLTITLSNGGSGGTLTGAGLSGGSGGVYTLSGTAAAITGELEALTFGSGAAGTSTLTLSDVSSDDATPTVNSTTTVTVTAPTGAISETAAYVSDNIDALNADANVTSITLTDSGTPTLTLTTAQALNDKTALGEITNANYAIAISDTAANVSANIGALNADAKVTSITLTGGGLLTLTAAHAIDDTTALGKITNIAIVVFDSAANVTASLDALNADTEVTSITLADTGTPTLTLTAAQALNDTSALGKITTAYAIAISDTAANVSANLAALNADRNVTSIALTDSGTPTLTLTSAQALGDTTALGKITNANYAVAISDTAANVAANLGALNADAKVTSITLTDSGTPTLTTTQNQALNDVAALAKIQGSYTLVISDPGVYNATAFTAAQVSVSINAGTPVLVTPNGTEILSGVTTIDLNGATITVNGDTLTQTNADGSSLVSTFDITGQIYTSRVIAYGSDGQLESKTYNGVTGDGTLSSFEYLYTSGNQVGSDFFYTGITDQAYTGEEVDYNGADQLTRVALTGVAGTGYSAYEYDYVGGVLEGSQFTVTDVPQGASYSSYQLDYNATGQFTGDKFFFTNLPDQSYNYEEEEFDANGQLAKVYISGVTGQAYSALEEDYSAGVYTGYKAYYAAPQGANYTTEEVDVNAANQIQKAVYTGMIGTPYSAVEVDYNNGAEADAIYAFTNVTDAAYNAYQVEENASGAVMETTYHLNNGGYAIVGAQNGLTINSIGDDTVTGGGSGETFVFNGVYGHDTITDFSSYATGANRDTISLSTSEFANFNAVTSAATNSGSNVVIAAANGDTLTLKNMNVATLSTLSSDFTFHA